MSLVVVYTVEPPIKDSLRRGHNKNNHFTKDTLIGLKCSFSILLIQFEPLKSEQPLYKGQNGWHKRVLYSEVTL